MVAGDMVNTASRIQAEAEPGTVYAGESTRRATEAAIAYEDAGERELKGKAEPAHLWRAVRVVGLRGGVVLASGLEPPFVGRERELHMIKELFHASADERRAHLVSVVGVGGIGKSRLSWEFEKYMDGLADDVWWHRGRCLAYGDGVAFWALAEMVRGRAGILEDEESGSARAKLRAALDEHLRDPDERRFVEPRLSHLLGLEERGGDQENLFSAWRIFFERLSETDPTVMVFEDIHWADSALLDFVEYLLEWSRDHPIFVLTLARPDIAERRPTWGAARRNFTSLFLEPLPPAAMDSLLRIPVPGLPDELRERILERAEGVPFYAVETVRMLLDRGLLVREGDSYHPAGPIQTLEVPETLQALIAARLDGLAEDERRLLQQASVLGRTFTVSGLVALTGLGEGDLQPLLASLVRKEVLSISADPLSPERGQYGFLQDLVKKVAYDTMAKKQRRALHLAAAEFLERGSGPEQDEVIEVVAAHYLDAYRAAPDAEDAGEVRERARSRLVRAAERAASLGANLEAQRYFERAAELTDDPLMQAELFEEAGIMSHYGAGRQDAQAHFERSMALFESQGATHPAARVSARLAEEMWDRGRLKDGLATMDRAFEVLSREEPDADLAWLAAQLGRFLYFGGDTEAAAQRIESALDIAEGLGLTEVLAEALDTKALILFAKGRNQEAGALLRYALEVALDNDKPSAALRAYNNLVDLATGDDQYEEARGRVQSGITLARRVGNRRWEQILLGYIYPLYALGRWDEALASMAELPADEQEPRTAFNQGYMAFGTAIHVHRGELDEAAGLVARFDEFERSADWQERAESASAKAWLFLGRGDPAEAFRQARSMLDVEDALAVSHHALKEVLVVGIQGAISSGDLDAADDLLAHIAGLNPARRPQFLDAHSLRLGAQLAALRGDGDGVDPGFRSAVGRFRELGLPFWLAVTLLEHGEWVASRAPAEAAPLLEEARSIFESLGAVLWLDRLAQVAGEGLAISRR
jgi:tetratricopeptide (TPR) repeat protein